MKTPAIWFPAIRTETGTDVFTENLVRELHNQGVRADVSWLPHCAEYIPFILPKPSPPAWANIIHVNSWLHNSLLTRKLPIITTVHHAVHRPECRQYKSKAQSFYHRYWIAPNERKILSASTRVVAVSRHVETATRNDLADIPMDVIYNGIDTQKFSPGEQDTKSKFRLLYVGTWTKRKGVDLLRSIMSDLGPEYQLLYTGSMANIKMFNMVNIGHVQQHDLVKIMQNADALLFPTRSEGLGLVVLEALACGLPVISTNKPPITELITDGENGFLCDIDNVGQFVKRIREIAQSETTRNKMKLQARASVEENFSIEEMARQYISLYQDVLSK